MPAFGSKLSVDPFEFAAREKTLTGSIYGSEDPATGLPTLLAQVAEGALHLTPRTALFPLEQVNEAIDLTLSGEPGRVLIEFGAG